MMSLARWVAFVVLVLLAAGAAAWLYLRREPAGRGRLLLAGLRAAALAIVLLLLFDPVLPARPASERTRGPHLLLDASGSMALPLGAGATASRWSAAVREARRRGGELLLFGERVRPAHPDSLGAFDPQDSRSQLLPALRAAADAGASRVVVITDGELEGAGSIPAWLARLGLGVEWVQVGEPLGGLSLQAIAIPPWAEAGKPLEIRLTVAAGADAADSAEVVVRQGGREVARQRVAAPAPGRSVELAVAAQPAAPPQGGFVQLEVALEPGDVNAADDRRFVSTFISAEPAGVTLVSLAPDQEPRFLLPVLARALGVPVTGYLRMAAGWVRAGGGAGAGERVGEAEVRRAAERAELLVIQGSGNAQPAWLPGVLGGRAALLLINPPPGGQLPVPASIGGAVEADWFLAARIPPSPLAPQLTGGVVPDLPPLSALQSAEAPGAWAPLLATRSRGGEPQPLLIAGESRGRRWAVALGQGYWQWAFQGGEGRALYEQLWSAVGGWLLGGAAGGEPGVRPVRRVVARGEASRWLAPGARLDSLRLSLVAAGGSAAVDTVLRAAAGDTLEAPVLPPGTYQYQARGFSGAQPIQGAGELTVESWSPELARPAAELARLRPAERLGGGAGEGGARRPLHTAPVPYVLLVLLLAAEWILRRRWGLR